MFNNFIVLLNRYTTVVVYLFRSTMKLMNIWGYRGVFVRLMTKREAASVLNLSWYTCIDIWQVSIYTHIYIYTDVIYIYIYIYIHTDVVHTTSHLIIWQLVNIAFSHRMVTRYQFDTLSPFCAYLRLSTMKDVHKFSATKIISNRKIRLINQSVVINCRR